MFFTLVALVSGLFVLAGCVNAVAFESPRMVFVGVAGAGVLIGVTSLPFFLLGLVV